MGRNGALQHCLPLGAAQKLDLLLGGRLDEGADHTPHAPEDERGVEEAELRQALGVVLLQKLKDRLEGLDVQIAHADACSREAYQPTSLQSDISIHVALILSAILSAAQQQQKERDKVQGCHTAEVKYDQKLAERVGREVCVSGRSVEGVAYQTRSFLQAPTAHVVAGRPDDQHRAAAQIDALQEYLFRCQLSADVLLHDATQKS